MSRITLDLDRGIYHSNFNLDKRDRLLAEQGEAVEQELWMELESWFVLRARRPGVSARRLARAYGLEELRDYIARSRREIDAMRGFTFAEGPPQAGAEDDGQRGRRRRRSWGCDTDRDLTWCGAGRLLLTAEAPAHRSGRAGGRRAAQSYGAARGAVTDRQRAAREQELAGLHTGSLPAPWATWCFAGSSSAPR